MQNFFVKLILRNYTSSLTFESFGLDGLDYSFIKLQFRRKIIFLKNIVYNFRAQIIYFFDGRSPSRQKLNFVFGR